MYAWSKYHHRSNFNSYETFKNLQESRCPLNSLNSLDSLDSLDSHCPAFKL